LGPTGTETKRQLVYWTEEQIDLIFNPLTGTGRCGPSPSWRGRWRSPGWDRHRWRCGSPRGLRRKHRRSGRSLARLWLKALLD